MTVPEISEPFYRNLGLPWPLLKILYATPGKTKRKNKKRPPENKQVEDVSVDKVVTQTVRDLLAWKGHRDAQTAKGQNCPFLYVKSPVAQFGHKIATILFTQ